MKLHLRHQHHPTPIIIVHGESHRDTRGPHKACSIHILMHLTGGPRFFNLQNAYLRTEFHLRKRRPKYKRPCVTINTEPPMSIFHTSMVIKTIHIYLYDATNRARTSKELQGFRYSPSQVILSRSMHIQER
jgi:hypothetical protein